MLLSKSAICGIKKSRFIRKQEASGILGSVGLKTPLCKIPSFGDIFLNAIPSNDFVDYQR